MIVFVGLTLFIFISLSFYQKDVFIDLFEQMSLRTKSVILGREREDEDSMCTTKWYKVFDLEFDVFAGENFSKVIFLMDGSYSQKIQDGMFKCLFTKYGLIFSLKDIFLKKEKRKLLLRYK